MVIIVRWPMMAEGDMLYRLHIDGILLGLARTLGRVSDPYPVRWYADHHTLATRLSVAIPPLSLRSDRVPTLGRGGFRSSLRCTVSLRCTSALSVRIRPALSNPPPFSPCPSTPSFPPLEILRRPRPAVVRVAVWHDFVVRGAGFPVTQICRGQVEAE